MFKHFPKAVGQQEFRNNENDCRMRLDFILDDARREKLFLLNSVQEWLLDCFWPFPYCVNQLSSIHSIIKYEAWFSPVRLIYSHSLLHHIIFNRTVVNAQSLKSL